MRVAELSRRTGVAVPTIKYYLREGLLPPGELTSPNQARYDERHVQRLKVVRALLDTGGLSVAAVKEVLAEVDTPDRPVFKVLGAVERSLDPGSPDEDGPVWQQVRERVEELVRARGWQVEVDTPPARSLIAALVSLVEVGQSDLLGVLDTYFEACERIAGVDVAYVTAGGQIDGMVERMVIGTVIGDAVLRAVRRMAQRSAAAGALGGTGGSSSS